ncbi:hypothetical protein SAMN05216294_2973 [Flagellimonas zhangzhouensis]|uniref:Uncharacterized protein n=1 Tax=Flagellimonas zhangzhouensis TaxID=1073328 RepID=A0A1H2YDY5_9FLAO|nr:hypothetical protein SAMN05216294_2973 [Allomuricauda zhangzhouensis]SDX03412.1 hypothetical protein SAMN04487892_3048 [Allomuricauda zhangzhouensis]
MKLVDESIWNCKKFAARPFCYLCNVKLLTFIFGLYILTLNALPCTDVSADVVSDNSQTVVVAASNLDHNHSVSDTCSRHFLARPFCARKRTVPY